MPFNASRLCLNTLKPKQNGRHIPDDIFKCIFLNVNEWISLKISLKFVLKGPINNIPALVQIMAWRRPGDKPLSEPMMVSLPTHICVTRPQCLIRHWCYQINSLSPVGCGFDFKCVIVITFMNISSAIAFRWTAQDPAYDKSTFVQVKAYCLTAPSHYMKSWISVDPDLCHHLASVGHSELNITT